MAQIAEPQLSLLDYVTAKSTTQQEYIALPAEDNTPEGLQALLDANARLRKLPWPQPFDITKVSTTGRHLQKRHSTHALCMSSMGNSSTAT